MKHGDYRGYFSETYNRRTLAAAGIGINFVQDNHSLSAEKGTVRGLHFQTPPFAQDCRIGPVHRLGGTWGARLHDELVAPADAPRIRKGVGGEDGYSGFTVRDVERGEEVPTELEGLLRERGVERVVVAGLATDYCVRETALDSVRLGFETTVLREAIRAVDLTPGDGERALAAMREAGAHLE